MAFCAISIELIALGAMIGRSTASGRLGTTRGRTLNIELIADEGALFTICYALQSCKGTRVSEAGSLCGGKSHRIDKEDLSV